MRILLHSSKTMKPERSMVHSLTVPLYLNQAAYINGVLQHLNQRELEQLMHINRVLAEKVQSTTKEWGRIAGGAAALTFRGDIYSGLSASEWDERDADFAQQHLIILSGLYGALRPFDEIKPYRLEMGYKLRLTDGQTLERYWEVELSHGLDMAETYINLTANEYYKIIKKQLSSSTVIAPKFLTINKQTNQPTFVTVHAKIARGSFANWLIKNKIDDPRDITGYNLLNYAYDRKLSTTMEPVFVCKEFGGLGLSVRLK